MNVYLRVAVAALLTGPQVGSASEGVEFSRHIRPILAQHCYKCHGPDPGSREADLRLDTEDGARAALRLEGGVPQLLARIKSSDPDLQMPPPEAKKPLSAAQVEQLERWVAGGAPWETHWAFEPLIAPAIPAVEEPGGGAALRGPIDRFVQARLAERGLVPSPEAPRETLIRRLTLDLTGLPPAPAEVDAFLDDASPEAYEKLVDRLLASPAYGERMAWNWLDAARYADSNGYQGDNERTMWPWRDWVVDAFNRNLPYDEFTVWQLAGDRFPQSTFEQRLATGFCRNHMINGEGGRIAEENRVDYVMDMTETMGTVWLGLTLNCCRCHDHKFDPLSQHDYYALFAFFNQTPVDGGGGNPQTPPVLAVPTADQLKAIEQHEKRLGELAERLRQREAELAETQFEWERDYLSSAATPEWRTLAPLEWKAEHQNLRKLEDGSLLAHGENPRHDTYSVTYRVEKGTITALRLEALQHESHTGGGLARSDSGNFVLTELEVEVRRTGDAKPAAVRFASAEASYEQAGFPIAQAFDGDRKTGWAVYSGKPIDRGHAGLFRLAEPLALPEGTTLRVTYRHDSVHASHNLGRFRLSASSRPEPRLEAADAPLLAALKTAPKARNGEQQAVLADAHRRADPTHVRLVAEREKVVKELAAVKNNGPKVMVMEDQSKPRATFVLERGLYNKRGVEIEARGPACLPPLPAGAPADRLALARWLVSRENPLTARVTVNRFWQQFFGVGLVKTTEDFGVQGEIPLQQDLLDWLAADFRDQGWDVKRLVRQIVTSHTYRQSSRIASPEAYGADPENRLLARGARFRLPAWMLRDQALAASGLLVDRRGGPPVNGYQPAGVWEEATFGNKKYKQDHGEALYRRSLYTFWRRIIAPTMFFDNASRQTCTVKVLRTNTPLHALLTLNDVTYVEAARMLAEQALRSAARDDVERIDEIFRRLLARRASKAERSILLDALRRARGEFTAEPAAALKLLAIGESPRDERLEAAEHAAWTNLALAVMNLDEALTKE